MNPRSIVSLVLVGLGIAVSVVASTFAGRNVHRSRADRAIHERRAVWVIVLALICAVVMASVGIALTFW